MEAKYLDPDEFDIECLVRNLKGTPIENLTALEAAFKLEAEHRPLKPAQAHNAAKKRPNDEIKLCTNKLIEHRRALANITDVTKVKEPPLDGIKTRISHVIDRLRRLSTSSRRYKQSCLGLIETGQNLLTMVDTLLGDSPDLNKTLNDINDEINLPQDEYVTTDEEADNVRPNQEKLLPSIPKYSQENAPERINTSTLDNNEPGGSQLSRDYMQQSTPSANIKEKISSLDSDKPASDAVIHNVHTGSNSAIHSTSNERCQTNSPLAKWNISYSGGSDDLSVKDFLFRVSHLAASYAVPDTKLRNEICLLLKGVAADWYWLHIRLHPHITWQQLQLDFEKRFRDHRTDYDIRRILEARKQKLREPFIEFYNAIQALNLLYSNPPPEVETFHMLKRNMRPGLQNALAARNINTIDELLQSCISLEDSWKRTHCEPELLCNRRFISEIDHQDINQPLDYYSENPENISAFETVSNKRITNVQNKTNVQSKNVDHSLIVCWNCRDIGHSYDTCTKERTRFCYGCGRPDIFKPNCFRCNSGNDQWRNRSAGNAMPPQRTPILIHTDITRNAELQ